MHGAFVVFEFVPAGTQMAEQHRRVKMETQNDVRVVGRHLQVLKGIRTLPHIGPNDQYAFRFTRTDGFVQFGQQLVPLFRFGSHRLIHTFIGHQGIGILFQFVRQLIPQLHQFFLLGRIFKQGILSSVITGVKMVRTNDMQINYNTQVTRFAPL